MFGDLQNEILILLGWYVVFMLLGVAILPFMHKYFADWKDGGYGLSKLIGLLVVSLPLWLLAALHIVPFTQSTTLIMFALLLGLSVWYARKTQFKFNRSILKWMILQEILFFIVFASWAFIRSTNSQVEGTEKMMNIAFMNSIFRTEYFPAADPWFAGGTINYYHLGHYMFTFVAKMTGIKIAFAYNLALNTIAGFTFIATFSIIVKLIQASKSKAAVLAGLFGATWLCFGSNMHYVYQWVSAIFSNKVFEYWFPDGTRIVTNAIDEFPAYSIPLGDLHGHYLGMPFFIIALAFLIIAFGLKINSKAKIRFNMLISIFIVSLYGINSWDFITMNFLFFILHCYQAATTYKRPIDMVTGVIINEISLLFVGLVFMIPYIMNFRPPVGGLGVVPIGSTSEILPWVQMWGMFLIITFVFLYTRAMGQMNYWLQATALFLFGCVFCAGEFSKFKLIEIVKDDKNIAPKLQMASDLWPNLGQLILIVLILAAIAIILTYLFKQLKQKLSYTAGKYESLVLIMNFAAFALLLGVEYLYVKDIFYLNNPPYFRTNTVFKFYYHAWIIWAIVCSYYVYQIFTTYLNSKEKIYRLVGAIFSFIIVFIFIGAVSYIFEGIHDFYPFMKYDNMNYPTSEQWLRADIGEHIKIYDSLDGNKYIATGHPGDYKAMQWFNQNVKGQPVIVEQVGDAYTYDARFSANVGLIDIVGWPSHEWQWRSNSVETKDGQGKITHEDLASKEAYARKDEVTKIYETQDEEEFKSLIAKYDVQYIILGECERHPKQCDSKASNDPDKINETFMTKYGAKVYDDSDTKIYEMKFI